MPLYQQAEKIRLSGTDEEFNAWYRMFISTPGGLDFSRAINIAVVKTAPEDLWKDPVKHREYFNRVMTESDHSKPDPLIVDIACGRSSSPMPQTIKENVTHDETKPPVPVETDLPAVCPGKAAQLNKELNEAFAQSPAPEEQASDQPRVENLAAESSVDALINNSPQMRSKNRKYHLHQMIATLRFCMRLMTLFLDAPTSWGKKKQKVWWHAPASSFLMLFRC